jgi:cell wall-associated NlpC family hydrolase
MKKLPHIFVILCTALLLPVTASPQEPKTKNTMLGIISAPLANVHEEPLPKSGLVTQVLMADEVRILEKQDYRYRIAIPSQDNREGWIQQEAVSIPKDKGRHYLNAERQWIVIAAPKTEALILDRTGNHKVPLYAGTRLPVLEKKSDGFTVQFPDRSVAIIDPADAIPVKPIDPVINDTTPEEIASTARKFLGVRYLAGGLTAQGMDTRGLIHIAYRIHGFPTGTDGASLKAKAERVPKKDLQPGDILVFHGENEGLFLGSGRFLQASRKHAVQLVGIYDRRYANALQYGLRIIGAGPDQKKTTAEMTADEILLTQARAARLPLGKRISYWASRFIGTPYDPDPLGLYVRTNRIVADEKVDCMYHTFRSVELARSSTPAGAIEQALSLRFITQGKLADGLVTNYDDRFQYGEDMVFSGKWGKNITAELGTTRTIPGSRGRDTVDILPKSVLATRSFQKELQDGDIIYWAKDPKKRAVEEIIAHLSIVRIKSGKPYLIHAAGGKEKEGASGGGVVKEVPFADYVHSMRFIGAFVTRFEQ